MKTAVLDKNKNYANKKHTKKISCFEMVVTLLILGCVTSFSANATLNVLYNIILCIEVLFFIITLSKCRISNYDCTIILILVVMALLRVISICYSEALYNIIAIVQLLLLVSILFTCDIIKIGEREVKYYNILLFIVCILGLVDYILSPDKIFFTIFGSMNTFAGVFLFLFVLDIVLVQFNMQAFYLINFLLCLVLIFLSSSRTPLLMLVCFLINVFVLNKMFVTYKLRKLLFLIYILLLVMAIYFYINVDKWSFYQFINELSVKYFGKNINSGRPKIWVETIKNIKDDWLFGVGHVEHAYGNSGHNQFIQLLGDNGVVGLVIFIIFLSVIWRKLAEYGNDKIVRICMALMLSFVVYNCFEVTLLQNKFALGCLEWLVIGIGLNRCKKLKYKQ